MSLFDGIKKALWEDPDEVEDMMDEEAEGYEQPQAAAAPAPAAAPAAKTARSVMQSGVKSSLQVVLFKPNGFNEILPIADQLNLHNTVLLNLENARHDSRRILDFLSGVAYANDSRLKVVASDIIIIAPNSVEMSGDLMDVVETQSLDF